MINIQIISNSHRPEVMVNMQVLLFVNPSGMFKDDKLLEYSKKN